MTSAIATSPRFRFFTNSGEPAANCLLHTYGAGTLVPKTTWKDQGQTTTNTNPIVLDANGECLLWLDAAQEYKFVLTTSTGSVISTTDDISGNDGLLRSDLSSQSGSSLVGFIQPGAGSVPRTMQDKARDIISVKDFGAVGDGVTNDGGAETTAHTAAVGNAVRYPFQLGESYAGVEAKYNMYGNAVHTRALDSLVQAGLSTNPTTQAQPITWIQKFSAANRDTIPTNWDQVGYFGLIKRGGDAYGAALTGYNLTQGGSGDAIGVHGRASCQNDNSRIYGGWFYANIDTGFNPNAAHGIEIDGRNASDDPGWGGDYNLLILGMADHPYDGNRFSTAIKIIQTYTAANGGFWTGLHIPKNAIIETVGALDDGENILLGGAEAGSVGGIRFGDGIFKYGLRCDEATFVNNNALLFATGQRIRWGDILTGVNVVGGGNSFTLSNSYMNIANPVSDTALLVASTKVLGARKTGWTAATGTPTRTAFVTSTVTLPQLAERVKALIDDLISHGLIGA